jgi:hypothetical protein
MGSGRTRIVKCSVKRFKSSFWGVEFADRLRLEFQEAPVLPTDFNLTFDAKTLRWCHLKWRTGNKVGGVFSTREEDLTQRLIIIHQTIRH